MKFIHKPLFRTPRLALAMSSLFALPVLAVDPAGVVPDESVAYMEMDSAAFYKLEEHPVVKTLPLKEIEKIFLKLTDSSVEEQEALKKIVTEEMGISYEELTKKFGRAAITIHDLKIPADPQPDNVGGEISAAVELDGDEAFLEKYVKVVIRLMSEQAKKKGGDVPEFEEITKKFNELMEHTTVEHGGAKIHLWKLKQNDDTAKVPKVLHEWALALQDKMLLFSSGQDGVEEMVDRLKAGGNAGSLAASSLYKKEHEKAGETIALASVNLEVILGLVEKYALPMAEGGDVDVKKIWTTLGADKLQSAVLAIGSGAEHLDLAALLTYSEKPGLFAIPALPGSGKPPAFLPKDIASGGYGQIDIDKSVENLIKTGTEVDARFGAMVQMGLGMAESQAGVDIRKDLLAQLGPDYWTAQAPPEKSAGSPNPQSPEAVLSMLGKTVLGVSVKDKKAFGLALDTVFNKVGGKEALFETREYQGFAINNVKQSPEEFRVGYVLTDDWFILSLGGGEILEKVLSRLGKDNDDGFFAQKAVTKTLDSMRSGQSMTSVTSLGEMFGAIISAIEAGVKQSGGDAPDVPFDELIKLFNVPLLSVDKAWIESTHLEYRMRIVPKGE